MKRTLLTIAVALTLAGCGHSDDSSNRALVERTIDQYFHAAAFGDGETSVPMHFTHVNQIVIDDHRATAYVTSERPPYTGSVVLARHGRSWKLLYLPVAIHRRQLPRVAAPPHH